MRARADVRGHAGERTPAHVHDRIGVHHERELVVGRRRGALWKICAEVDVDVAERAEDHIHSTEGLDGVGEQLRRWLGQECTRGKR